MWSFLSGPELTALGSVIVIDIVMSGDNAIIIGMAAAGLPPALRRRAIVTGIAAATVLRIGFAYFIVYLLEILGLTLAGGLLLVWVCWRMWRDIRGGQMQAPAPQPNPGECEVRAAPPKTLWRALLTIVVADVTMSLDNVLAVAGAAHEYPWVLVFGLVLSIALMAQDTSKLRRCSPYALNAVRLKAWISKALVPIRNSPRPSIEALVAGP